MLGTIVIYISLYDKNYPKTIKSVKCIKTGESGKFDEENLFRAPEFRTIDKNRIPTKENQDHTQINLDCNKIQNENINPNNLIQKTINNNQPKTNIPNQNSNLNFQIKNIPMHNTPSHTNNIKNTNNINKSYTNINLSAQTKTHPLYHSSIQNTNINTKNQISTTTYQNNHPTMIPISTTSKTSSEKSINIDNYEIGPDFFDDMDGSEIEIYNNNRYNDIKHNSNTNAKNPILRFTPRKLSQNISYRPSPMKLETRIIGNELNNLSEINSKRQRTETSL